MACMRDRAVAMTVLTTVIVASTAPIAIAQDAEDWIEHTDAKLAKEHVAMAGNETKYVGHQTSPEGIAEEVDWLHESACLAEQDLERTTGEDVPAPLGPCPVFDNVVAAADPDPDDADPGEDEPQAVAEPLEEDDPLARTEDLGEETLAAADRIVSEPTTAPDELQALVERIAAFAEATIEAVLELLLAPASGLMLASHNMAELGNDVRTLTTELAMAPLHGVYATATVMTDVSKDLRETSGDAIGRATATIEDSRGAVLEQLQTMIDGLLTILQGRSDGVDEAAHGAKQKLETSRETLLDDAIQTAQGTLEQAGTAAP